MACLKYYCLVRKLKVKNIYRNRKLLPKLKAIKRTDKFRPQKNQRMNAFKH